MLTREPDPEMIPDSEKKLPYHAKKNGSLVKCSHYIVYEEDTKKEPLIKYDMEHIKSLPLSWIFQCIEQFELIEPKHDK